MDVTSITGRPRRLGQALPRLARYGAFRRKRRLWRPVPVRQRAYGGRAAINWATGPRWRRVCWGADHARCCSYSGEYSQKSVLSAVLAPGGRTLPRGGEHRAGRHGTGNVFSRRGRLWPPRCHGRGQRMNRRASSLCPLGTPHRMCWTAHEVPGQSGKTPKFASAPALFRPRVNPEGKHSRREGGDPSRAT